MEKKRIDLRSNEWREAITELSDTIQKSPLENRAIALLIVDSIPSAMKTKIGIKQVLEILHTIPRLKIKYLK